MSSKPKPRRWIERLPVKRKGDQEHHDFIVRKGLEAYVENHYWKLSDYEMGQVNHPGVDFNCEGAAREILRSRAAYLREADKKIRA